MIYEKDVYHWDSDHPNSIFVINEDGREICFLLDEETTQELLSLHSQANEEGLHARLHDVSEYCLADLHGER